MQAENNRTGFVGRTGQCWGTACRSPTMACAVSGSATKPTACKALNERRYRRNWCMPF